MARNGFRKQTISMRGIVVDMDALRAAGEQSVAVGAGSKMNARGDILGRNGQIEVRREQIARDYYANNPQAGKQVSLKPAIPDAFETPDQAVARLTGAAVQSEIDTPQGLAQRPRGRKLVDKSDD